MKCLITENQLESTRKKLIGSIRKFGFGETLDRFSLSFKTFEKIFQGTKLPRLIGCILQDIFYELYKESPRYFESKDGELILVLDYNYAIEFTITSKKNKDFVQGYATPYYDCTGIIPIDFEFYNWYTDESKYHYVDVPLQLTYNMEDKDFRSIPEMREWFLNEYPEILFKYANEVFKEYRE
jgi:hypothetical protein